MTAGSDPGAEARQSARPRRSRAVDRTAQARGASSGARRGEHGAREPGLSPGVTGALGAALALIMLRRRLERTAGASSSPTRSAGRLPARIVEAAVAGDGLDAGAEARDSAAPRLAAGLFCSSRFAYRRIRPRPRGPRARRRKARRRGGRMADPADVRGGDRDRGGRGTGRPSLASEKSRRARALRATARIPFGAFFAPAIWGGWLLDMRITDWG